MEMHPEFINKYVCLLGTNRNQKYFTVFLLFFFFFVTLETFRPFYSSSFE